MYHISAILQCGWLLRNWYLQKNPEPGTVTSDVYKNPQRRPRPRQFTADEVGCVFILKFFEINTKPISREMGFVFFGRQKREREIT